MITDTIDSSQESCEHRSFYEEGEGDDSVRCCPHCGFIQVKQYKILSEDEGNSIRKRAGVSQATIDKLSLTGDINREIVRLKRERIRYGMWAVVYIFMVLYFRQWLFEPATNRGKWLFLVVILSSMLGYIFLRLFLVSVKIRMILTGNFAPTKNSNPNPQTGHGS